MSTLEQIIGQPLHECSDEELMDLINKTRSRRLSLMEDHIKEKAQKKSSSSKPIYTLTDDDLEDL